MKYGYNLRMLFEGDHLGSSSLAYDVVSDDEIQTLYRPFGEVRFTTTDTTLPTHYTYTGQYSYMDNPSTSGVTEGFGLMFYQSRFYDPYLNHFTQPDSIVPDPSNPQDWDRYAYARNNPLLYTDPTGHTPSCDDGPTTWANCKQQLRNFSQKTLKDMGGEDDLETMIKIVDKAVQLYKNYDDIIPALSDIFLGIEESNSMTVYNAASKDLDPCAAVGRPECNPNAAFGDEGFHEDFQDGQSQPFHFWAYLATAANTEGVGPSSYLPGRIVSNIANFVHEIVFPDGAGATWQDYALARAGMNIGTLVNIGAVSPDQLGNTIRDFVGVNGPGAPYVTPLKMIVPLVGNRQ